MEYYTYGSDTALRDRTAVELPPADLIEFDNLNHLVLAGLTVKSTRRASGARVVESPGENVRLLALRGHRLVRCTCLLLTQSGHARPELRFIPYGKFESAT
jgi:hypothetical protein